MPPFPPPQSPISLNHPYLSLPSPHLLFHFRDSLSFGQHGGMIVASARGGEANAIITPRAIINSVSDGDGRRRMVDCYGVLGDHIGGLCLFSGSPHSPVKLFCRRSHCQPHSAEDCRQGNTILLERIWSSCCLLKGFQMCSCQDCAGIFEKENSHNAYFQPCYGLSERHSKAADILSFCGHFHSLM